MDRSSRLDRSQISGRPLAGLSCSRAWFFQTRRLVEIIPLLFESHPGAQVLVALSFFFLARFNYPATSFVLASRVPRTFSQRRSIKRETTSRQHSLERNQQRRLFVRSASTKREDEIWLRRVVHSFRVVSPFKTLFLGTYGDCRLSFFSTDSENRRLAHSRFSRLKSARLFALAKVRSSAVSPRVANAFKDGLRGSTSRLHCTRIERTCRDDQTRSLKDIFKPCREDDRVSSPSTISFSHLEAIFADSLDFSI